MSKKSFKKWYDEKSGNSRSSFCATAWFNLLRHQEDDESSKRRDQMTSGA